MGQAGATTCHVFVGSSAQASQAFWMQGHADHRISTSQNQHHCPRDGHCAHHLCALAQRFWTDASSLSQRTVMNSSYSTGMHLSHSSGMDSKLLCRMHDVHWGVGCWQEHKTQEPDSCAACSSTAVMQSLQRQKQRNKLAEGCRMLAGAQDTKARCRSACSRFQEVPAPTQG